jgi:hypothetical protein
VEHERQVVVVELTQRVHLGYSPDYSYESACDHNTDWLVLSREEFEAVKVAASRSEA